MRLVISVEEAPMVIGVNSAESGAEMRIAIDGSKAINETAGVARYTRELSRQLFKLYPEDSFFLFFNFCRGREIKTSRIKDILNHDQNVRYRIYPLPGNLKEFLFSSPFSLTNFWLRGNDLYHAPDFLSFDHGLKIPQVLTVHDLTMIIFPQYLGKEKSQRYGRMLERACQKATHIIAVSAATKQDLIKYFKLNKEKITVTPLGFDPRFKKIREREKIRKVLAKYNIHFPYILFVGTIEPRKNIENLLLAFDQFSQSLEGKDYHLILIGKKGWHIEAIDQTCHKLLSREKIKFLDFISDEDLLYFYNSTSLFCYPSIYEGFGLPLLEAMACETPVLTSQISSLPEVGGSAPYYVNPYHYQEIAQGMKKILSNKQLARQMALASLKQAKKFSWGKCVRETHEVYKEISNIKYQKSKTQT